MRSLIRSDLCVCVCVSMCVRQFPSSEDAMNGARHIVAMQIAHDPLVRACVRQMFHERAKITLTLTKKGIKVQCSVLSLLTCLCLLPLTVCMSVLLHS